MVSLQYSCAKVREPLELWFGVVRGSGGDAVCSQITLGNLAIVGVPFLSSYRVNVLTRASLLSALSEERVINQLFCVVNSRPLTCRMCAVA